MCRTYPRSRRSDFAPSSWRRRVDESPSRVFHNVFRDRWSGGGGGGVGVSLERSSRRHRREEDITSSDCFNPWHPDRRGRIRDRAARPPATGQVHGNGGGGGGTQTQRRHRRTVGRTRARTHTESRRADGRGQSAQVPTAMDRQTVVSAAGKPLCRTDSAAAAAEPSLSAADRGGDGGGGGGNGITHCNSGRPLHRLKINNTHDTVRTQCARPVFRVFGVACVRTIWVTSVVRNLVVVAMIARALAPQVKKNFSIFPIFRFPFSCFLRDRGSNRNSGISVRNRQERSAEYWRWDKMKNRNGRERQNMCVTIARFPPSRSNVIRFRCT